MKRRMLHLMVILSAGLMFLSACSTNKPVEPGKVQIVATTSILADVVKQVAGDYGEVTPLVPVGVNEHEYQPAPQDIALVSDSDLVFEVGLGLEEFMTTIIQNVNTGARIVTASDGITPQQFQGVTSYPAIDVHTGGDPHVWLDPANVIVWVQNTEAALSKFDPDHSAAYHANSLAYIDSLLQLDSWIQEQVAQIPVDKRKIVTDHMLFGYFAGRYGFEVIGAVIPAYSSSSQPSAKELAALEDAIRKYNVRVILVGNNVNPALSGRVAQDTGIELVPFYTGSLSDSSGPAGTYIEYMHFNVNEIVNALSR